MGGRSGCSIEHYIIKMVQFILNSMNGNPDAAVIAVPVDYSKAFNRMQHSDILINLIALNVPTCAVKLIKSYLTQRSMCVRFNGAVSSFQKCPGGGPQGGLLTSLLFCLQVNKAGSPCSVPRAPSLGQIPALHPATTSPSHPSLGQIAVQGPATSPEEYQVQPCQDKKNLHKKAYIDFIRKNITLPTNRKRKNNWSSQLARSFQPHPPTRPIHPSAPACRPGKIHK